MHTKTMPSDNPDGCTQCNAWIKKKYVQAFMLTFPSLLNDELHFQHFKTNQILHDALEMKWVDKLIQANVKYFVYNTGT